MKKIIFLIVIGLLFILSVKYLINFITKVKKVGFKKVKRQSGTFLTASIITVCCSLLIGFAFLPEIFKKPLPNNVETARVTLNDQYSSILTYEENYPNADYEIMYGKYLDLQNITSEYRQMLSDIGQLERFNYEFENLVNERTQHYLSQASKPKIKESNRHVCNICGKQFVGRGYEERSTGLWVNVQAPYQSFICSKRCGAVHTERQVKRYGF